MNGNLQRTSFCTERLISLTTLHCVAGVGKTIINKSYEISGSFTLKKWACNKLAFYPTIVLFTLSRFFADVSCVKWNSIASIADQFVGRILFCSGTYSHLTLRIQTGYNVVGAGNTSNSWDRRPWLWRTCIFKLIYHNVFIHKLFNKQILLHFSEIHATKIYRLTYLLSMYIPPNNYHMIWLFGLFHIGY